MIKQTGSWYYGSLIKLHSTKFYLLYPYSTQII